MSKMKRKTADMWFRYLMLYVIIGIVVANTRDAGNELMFVAIPMVYCIVYPFIWFSCEP